MGASITAEIGRSLTVVAGHPDIPISRWSLVPVHPVQPFTLNWLGRCMDVGHDHRNLGRPSGKNRLLGLVESLVPTAYHRPKDRLTRALQLPLHPSLVTHLANAARDNVDQFRGRQFADKMALPVNHSLDLWSSAVSSVLCQDLADPSGDDVLLAHLARLLTKDAGLLLLAHNATIAAWRASRSSARASRHRKQRDFMRNLRKLAKPSADPKPEGQAKGRSV